MFTATIHSDRWFDAVRAKARQLNITTGEVMVDEARLFTGTLINLTPPTRGRGPNGSIADPKLKHQAVGEKSARRDVLRSMTPADPDWPEGARFLQNPRVRKVVMEGNAPAFAAILKNMGGAWAQWRTEYFDPSLHYRAQGSRGRVHRTKKIFIIGVHQLNDYWQYLRKVLSHVGRLKAGWLPAFLTLGGKRVPAFVKRHLNGARGRIELSGLSTSNPRILVSNSAMGVGELESLVNNTFKARAQAIKRRMKLLASNFAKGDVAAIKAVRAAHGDIEAPMEMAA